MAKLETEPRLQGTGLPAALIEWCRRVVQVVNPLVDAIGPVRVPALSVSEALDGPAFRAYQTVSQSMPHATLTKLVFNTEAFDTAGAFTPAIGRFQPQVAGYYQINAAALLQFGGGNLTVLATYLSKNGAVVSRGAYQSFAAQSYGCGMSDLVFLNGSTDYVEFFAYAQTSTGAAATTYITESIDNYFSGHLARRA